MITTWKNAYEDRWAGVLTDESHAHPAKFAKGLIERIVDYLLANGYLQAGDLVVDPFGGIASGGIVCAYRGLNWLGVELEPRFILLGQGNIDLHTDKLRLLGKPIPRLVQGDSRRLAEIVGQAAGVVGSPPFMDQLPANNKPENYSGFQHVGSIRNRDTGAYGDNSPGQLAALPPGSIDSVISSPPYADEVRGKHGETETAAESTAKRQTEGGSLGQSQRSGGYGTSEGNLSNLAAGQVEAVVSSPPFLGAHAGAVDESSMIPPHAGLSMTEGYGTTPGNLANLPAGIVGSPPYEGSLDNILPRSDDGHDGGAVATFHRTGKWPERREKGLDYGTSPGQLGNESTETFWSASCTIMKQCWEILRPGGVCVWVCKDFVRKGKRVPFSDDWQRLCEACGFVLVERIHASLVKEDSHASLFGGNEVKRTERKSFFRRLAEKKGSPKIDHEDVLIFRKGTP